MAMSDETVSQALDNAMDWVFKTADLVSEYLDEEKEAYLNELDACMKELCTVDRTFILKQKIISKLEEDNADTSCDYDQLKSALDESVEKNRGKLDYKKHERYPQFLEKLKPANAENETTGDEELVCTESGLTIKDPYTKAFIQNPIKNKICNHHYDKAYVMALLKKKKKLTCPYAGCGSKKPFTMEDLVEDRHLTKQILEAVQSSQDPTGASTSGISVTE